MVAGHGAGDADLDAAGVGLRGGDKLFPCFEALAQAGDRFRFVHHVDDGRKGIDREIGLLGQRRDDDAGPYLAERITVGSGFGDFGVTGDAASSGAILDRQGLAEVFFGDLRRQTGGHVGGAAGGKGNDDLDGLAGIVVGETARGDQKRCCCDK